MKDKKNLTIGVLIGIVIVLVIFIFISINKFRINIERVPRTAQQDKKPIENIIKPFTQAKTTAEIAEEGKKATVFIVTRSKIGLEVASGSGFIVSEDGKIVTNFHVIENAYYASIKLANGDVYDEVDVVNHDERRDIAILKIKGLKFNAVTLGNSETIKVGEKVVAIGNPEGLENTVSEGILSSTRNLEGVNMLQITAPISHGSSGGPLFDSKGNVIGITSATFTEGQNLNFAIPIDYVKPLIVETNTTELAKFQDEFVKKKWIGGKFDITRKSPFQHEKEERKYAFFGVFWVPTEDLKRSKIIYFRPYSPARDAGIKIGDEIIAIKGVNFTDQELVPKLFIDELQPGEEVPVKLLRKGTEMTINVKLGVKPKAIICFEGVSDALLEGKKVRIAIFIDEINFIGNINQTLEDWKKSIRSQIINDCQEMLSSLRNNKNFTIIDTGKIDIILNDLENRYGPLLPQARDNILQSLGVTHLLSVSFSRYSQDKFFPYVGWKRKFRDDTIVKLIDLNSGEFLCSDELKGESNWDGEFKKPSEWVGEEKKDILKGYMAQKEELKSRGKNRKN